MVVSIFLFSLTASLLASIFVFIEHLKATYGIILAVTLLPFLTIYSWREKSINKLLKVFVIVFLFYSAVMIYDSYPDSNSVFFNQLVRELAIDKSVEILEEYKSYALKYDYRPDLQSTSIFSRLSRTYFCSAMFLDGESVILCSYFTRTVYAVIRPYAAVIVHHMNATSPLIIFIKAGFLVKKIFVEKIERSTKKEFLI